MTVPGDTQLQAGFTGEERFNESKELIAVNGKEWWYRKHFKAGAKAEGAVSRLVFDGSDYFTTVWLNGQLLGTHEGTYTAFSFDVTGVLRYGGENVIAVLVTHPVAPKGGSLLEYLDGTAGGHVSSERHGGQESPLLHLRTLGCAAGTGQCDLCDGNMEERSPADGERGGDRRSACGDGVDCADGSATLRVGVTLKNAGQETRTRTVTLKLTPENLTGAAVGVAALVIKAAPGETTAETEVRVPDARLWWSWDKGAQNLYTAGGGEARGGRLGRPAVGGVWDSDHHARRRTWRTG